MSIKDKIKSAWNNVTKHKVEISVKRKNKADSELSADEVAHEEIFPKKTVCNKKQPSDSAKKPASKRTRPTNNNYEMIDPDNNTCDTGKS